MAKAPAPKSENQIVKPASAGPIAMPSYIEKGRKGFETVDAQDVMFERIAMMQDLSPQVKNRTFQVGDIIRRTTDDVLYTRGGSPVPFVVCYYFKEFVEFGDRNNPSEPMIIARSTERSSPLAESARQWEKKKQSDGKLVRKVTDVHNFIVLLEGRLMEPMTISCMRSNSKAGSGLLSLINGRGDAPIYAGFYNFVSDDETNKKNQTYSVYKFRNNSEPDRFWAPPEMYEAAKAYYELMAAAHKAGNLKADYTEVDNEDVAGAAGGGDDKDI